MSDEVIDPKPALEKQCAATSACQAMWAKYAACTKRIEGDTSGAKHCSPQYFQFWHCVDKCAAPKLFKLLK